MQLRGVTKAAQLKASSASVKLENQSRPMADSADVCDVQLNNNETCS